MSKTTIKRLVPKLRFPEFRDAGEWDEKKLEEVASFSKGKGISKSDVTADGKQPCIRYGELYTRYNETIENVSSYTNIPAKNLVLSKANDVIIPASGETQEDIATASCVMKSGIALGGDLNIISSKMNGVFLSYYLNSAKKYSIAQMSQGISVVHLYSSQLKNLDLNIPDNLEQQKIADCLSSLDALITAHSQKHQALKAHKKGLMQQLFPATGKTLPKLRFPEFRDAGEWEDKNLGDLSRILRGGSPRPIDDYITLENNGLNWLKIADVNKEAKYVTCTKERVLVTALSKTREVNPGDLIMSNSMSFGRPYILKIKTCIHDGWIAVTEIDEQANRDYLYYLILSPESQAYFLNNAAGSGVQNLNADIIKLLPVLIPKDPKEQEKIADCLSSLDALITAQAQKIESLKAHKKGLMQQIFPAEELEV